MLKGKASEVKNLVPVLVEVTAKHLRNNDFERLMYKGLLQSWAIDKCVADNMSFPRYTYGFRGVWASRHTCGLRGVWASMWPASFLLSSNSDDRLAFGNFRNTKKVLPSFLVLFWWCIYFGKDKLDRYSGQTLDLFRQACNQYNQIIVDLGMHAQRAARLFNFTIKNHCLEHCALDSAQINPGWVWTFASEGFLARVRKLVQACTPGSTPSLVHKKVMRHYVKALMGALHPQWQWL